MKTHDPIHRRTWDLIPWLVNDTLDETQQAAAEAHLRECADCREELAFQRNVQAGMSEDLPVADAAASAATARLFERIDAEDEAFASGLAFDPLDVVSARPVSGTPATARRLRLAHLLAAAVIVEAIGLVGLGTMLAAQRDTPARAPEYATLSRGELPAAGASIRLVPSPSLSLGDLQSLLGEAGLRILDSNAGGTIFALGFDDSSLPATGEPAAQRLRVDAALQRLRANSGVLLAEPILVSSAASH